MKFQFFDVIACRDGFRMIGRTQDGKAVMINISNFHCYFYVSGVSETQLFSVVGKMIFRLTKVYKKSVVGYSESDILLFKIEIKNPLQLKIAVERVKTLPNAKIFEAQVDATLRFLTHNNLKGFSWVNADSCSILSVSENDDRIAPFRVMSIDIEVVNYNGCFPNPLEDQIVTIACATQTIGSKELNKVLFVIGTCDKIEGVTVASYEDEHRLLLALEEYIVLSDPDIIIGYNVASFDLKYIYNRCRAMGMQSLRIGKNRESFYVHEMNDKGVKKVKAVIPGRVVFDVYAAVMQQHRLRSYKLGDVCEKFLGDTKEDVRFTEIAPLFRGTSRDRKRLAQYCLKDAILPLLLAEKLKLIVNAIEMCRVTGITLQMLCSRGQQIKIMSQLLRECKKQNYVIPSAENKGKEFAGALVIEPLVGYYNVPIVVLDYASLYPSIMIAHNLCYTTLLTKEQAAKMSTDDYEITPCGEYFVKKHVKRGLLPQILEGFLSARANTKKKMKSEEVKNCREKYDVLDGQQLAFKVCANSVYGFTGAKHGYLQCVPVSFSVTAYGKQMLEYTKEVVENYFTQSNNFENNATVIYGDTDSVLISFGNISPAKADEYAKTACKIVTFPPPIELEYEKMYLPYLLMRKKRYAGLIVRLDKDAVVEEKIDCKGIELCRRDNCKMLVEMMEKLLNMLLRERASPKQVGEYVKSMIKSIHNKTAPLQSYVITKELKKPAIAYMNKQPHAELAEKMRKRGDPNTPEIGDRVNYVVTRGPQTQIYQRVENPEYFCKKPHLTIDSKYYIRNQLEKPLSRLLEPVLGKRVVQEIFGNSVPMKPLPFVKVANSCRYEWK